MTKEQRENKNRIQREWYHSHLEHARKYNREYARAHYIPHPRQKRVYSDHEIAEKRALLRAKKNTERKRQYNRDYYLQHKEYFAKKRQESRQRLRLLIASSPELYAIERNKSRLKHKRIRDRTRKRPYHACMCRRIPDTCVFCSNQIDRTSVFLRNNMDENTIRSCDNYIMNLRIERKKQRRTYVWNN